MAWMDGCPEGCVQVFVEAQQEKKNCATTKEFVVTLFVLTHADTMHRSMLCHAMDAHILLRMAIPIPYTWVVGGWMTHAGTLFLLHSFFSSLRISCVHSCACVAWCSAPQCYPHTYGTLYPPAALYTLYGCGRMVGGGSFLRYAISSLRKKFLCAAEKFVLKIVILRNKLSSSSQPYARARARSFLAKDRKGYRVAWKDEERQ